MQLTFIDIENAGRLQNGKLETGIQQRLGRMCSDDLHKNQIHNGSLQVVLILCNRLTLRTDFPHIDRTLQVPHMEPRSSATTFLLCNPQAMNNFLIFHYQCATPTVSTLDSIPTNFCLVLMICTQDIQIAHPSQQSRT